MLNSFDWLRRSESGAQLLATLTYLAENTDLDIDDQTMEIGPPHSALHSPCQRCWIYPTATYDKPHCEFCEAILAHASQLGNASRRAVLIWGFVNQLPSALYNSAGFENDFLAGYVYDDHHFMVAIHQRGLKEWLQNLVLYHGFDLRGLLQIFPTMGSGGRIDMSGILCSVIHREASLPMDQLRVRFYPAPYHVLKPQIRDRKGLLTFRISDFLGYLEMALVFRTVLHPQEQQILRDLLTTEDNAEKQFFWGRFYGSLNQEARDMLYAWNIRQWSKERVKLLYELANYVYYR
ncbi:MAG: type III-I CRISPR-associated protein Cas10i [Ardenticatenaceae bacterium]